METHSDDAKSPHDELDRLILSEYPYPIAANYQRLLDSPNWEARTRKCIELYEYGLRAIALGVLSQYLIRDVGLVSDAELNRMLYRHMAEASLGTWTDYLFLGLRAYNGKRDRFFMPELYDFYWDTSVQPERPRKGLRPPFDRLAEIRNDLSHLRTPKDEVGWESLGREALELLRTILRHFSFLQHYDLIRVIRLLGDEYEYERYTGQEVTMHKGMLRDEVRLGWFYLLRQDQAVLALHPLFIVWTVEGEQKEKYLDAAVFDRFLKELVWYLTMVLHEPVKERDAEIVAWFQKLSDALKQRETVPKRAAVTWITLRQTALELSTQHMGAMEEKYRPELYLQRDDALGKFQAFLTSDRACFVLTGKSGVGKSNFVLSLANEFANRDDVCLLMYNAARLSASDAMVRAINEDLAVYLKLEGDARPDLFAHLDQRGEMTGKTLIVIFDAINENTDGKALLQQIDQMVDRVRYPWLKVVITSRPQAWHTLKRGLHLAEDRYFREQGSDEYWVELPEFTIQLKPFEREELRRAYEKYQKVYHLQTEYSALNSQLRSLLRDPLILRLVAEIYHDQSIPERIRVSDIYDQYVQALIRTERLFERDLMLLQRELMPLMIAESHYDNKVRAVQIQTAKTSDGRPLWELIRNDDLLSNGQPINSSYTRLVDAEILTEQGSPIDYEIVFKYERFYDYYGGTRLLELIDQRVDQREDIYRELITILRTHSFLWGPSQNALITELVRKNTQLYISLAQVPEDVVSQLLVSALTDYGHDDLQTVQPILAQLVSLKGSATSQRGRFKDISPELFSARKVAIESAASLEMGPILVSAACDSVGSVRLHAVQYIQRLWDQNDKVALGVLTSLSKRLRNRLGIPRSAMMESLVGASGLIAFKYYKDANAMKSLQQLWQGILDQLPFIHGTGAGMFGTYRKRIRRVVIFFTVRLLVRIMWLFPSSSNLNYEELDHFFHLPLEEKQRFRRLLPYMDPTHGNLEDIHEELIAIATSQDILTMYLVYLMLTARGMQHYEEVAPFLEPMFRRALNLDQVGPISIGVLGAIYNILAKPSSNPNAEAALTLFDKLVWDYYTKSGCVYWTSTRKYQDWFIDAFICRNYELNGTYYPKSLLEYLSKDSISKQFTLHRLFVGPTIEVDRAFGMLDMFTVDGYSVLALRVSELLLNDADPDTRKGIYKFLARMRKTDRDLVDDFIEEHNLKFDDIRRVEPSVSSRTIQDTLVLTAVPFLFQIQSQPVLFREIRAILEGILGCRNVAQLVELFLTRVVNFIYGRPVL